VLLAPNQVGEALKHLQEAVRLDPANPRSLLGLAEALAARGAYDVTVEMLERAMKLALTEELAKEIFAKRVEFLKLRKG
jgi:cytochrome c-type biogenesis protein CcmH/NrfG